LNGQEALQDIQQIWKNSTGATISARRASGGLCIVWNIENFHLESSHESTHWLMVKLVHLSLGNVFHIVNVHMPNNYWEKSECWESLLGIKDTGYYHNCIIVGNFNTNLQLREKRGGYIVRNPSRKNMEDLISTLDLFDVQPSKGNFTWNNIRVGPGHIEARLDHFLIHSSLLILHYDISSYIIMWASSNH